MLSNEKYILYHEYKNEIILTEEDQKIYDDILSDKKPILNDDEIILTDKNNTTTSGIPFPQTPRPEVRYDGFFL